MRSKTRTQAEGRPRATARGQGLPSPEALIAFLRDNPEAAGTREIARAFGLGSGDRPALRTMLRNIGRSGELVRGGNRRFAAGEPLPEMMQVERAGSDADGFPLVRPVAWTGPGEAPLFRLAETAAGDELPEGGRAISRLTIAAFEIPTEFPHEALAEAAGAKPVEVGDRADLRDLALVTIDGEDARDFDDAVWAEPDDNPENRGGWHIVVAIADVSHYVRPGSALDREAAHRGNSVYFPDRVVPMLPEALSNDLCSLRPAEDRACVAAHSWIDASGR